MVQNKRFAEVESMRADLANSNSWYELQSMRANFELWYELQRMRANFFFLIAQSDPKVYI